MSRNFGIALIIAAGVHVFLMSAVIIVNPAADQRIKPMIPINSLGPLLKKTAFDIMMENVTPTSTTVYEEGQGRADDLFLLKAEPPKRQAVFPARSSSDLIMNSSIIAFLSGDKTMPGFMLGVGPEPDVFSQFISGARKVMYKPENPSVIKGVYGENLVFRMKAKVFVSPDGMVKKVEPVTTTGNSHLDMLATKFIKNWVFEPKSKGEISFEWEEVEVAIEAKEK